MNDNSPTRARSLETRDPTQLTPWSRASGPGSRLARRTLLRFSLVATTAVLVAACRVPGASSSATPSAAASPVAPASPTVRAATVASTSSAAGATTRTASPLTATPVAASATPTSATPGPAATLTPTDSRVDEDDVTPSLTEGPYFKPNSPERTSLLTPGMSGTKLTLSGQVLSTRGQPIAKALLDFWQADAKGSYDNAGYTLRGHQYADAEGHYQLVTVIPGLYPGRTRHIHVKVQAPNHPVLTTQLFFPNEPQNATDPIFSPKLVLPIQDAPDGSKVATFNFVLDVG